MTPNEKQKERADKVFTVMGEYFKIALVHFFIVNEESLKKKSFKEHTADERLAMLNETVRWMETPRKEFFDRTAAEEIMVGEGSPLLQWLNERLGIQDEDQNQNANET